MWSKASLPLAALSLAAAMLLNAGPANAEDADWGQNHGPREVFAHYLVTNQDYQSDDPTGELKIAAYEKEIQQAQAAGIDGFALNAGGWTNQDYYVRYSSEIFEAAYRLHSGFKLFFSADMCCGNAAVDVEDMIRRYANNPRYRDLYYRRDGRFVLSTFAGEALGPNFWQQVKTDLTTGSNPSTYNNSNALSYVQGVASSAPLPVFFIPAFFWGGETPATPDIQQGLSQYQNIVDGSFYWGIAGVPGQGTEPDQIPSSNDYAQVLHGAGKQYMAPVTMQFWGANANRYYEYSGYDGMRRLWLDAIYVSQPNMIEIITWNDFVEGTYVSPIDDPNKYQFANFLFDPGVPLFTTGFWHTHVGATDQLKYYIEWYKTGHQPQIHQDAIYWAYRTQSKDTTATTGQPTIGTVYGPLADDVYVSAFLREPAQLKVNAGSGVQTLHLHEGYNAVAVPFTPTNTAPSFELDRENGVVLSGTGVDAILTTAEYNDYYYSTGDLMGARGGDGARP